MSLINWIHELWNGLIYPLRDNRWLAKSWPLPLIALTPFVALLAPIIYKGWRLSAVRQLTNKQNTLPELDLIAFFRRGVLLWLFTFAYWMVPVVICLFLDVGMLDFFMSMSSIGNDQTFVDWGTSQAIKWAIALSIYAIWALVTVPIYMAGVVRYALTDSWRSMLNLPANTALFLRHIPSFILFYINWLVILFLITLGSGLLAITIVGVPLLPVFILTAYYVTTAYELGQLARKVSLKKAASQGRVAGIAS